MSSRLYDRLGPDRQSRLNDFERLLREFNRRINLVSRSDADVLFERHILHALALTIKRFPAGATVVDWGTGGGLPGIPLAVTFPDVRFIAVDAVDKKIRAVRAMARRLALTNLETWSGRAEEFPHPITYSVSRASTSLAELWSWHERVRKAPPEAPPETCWRPGLVCLKGGDLRAEIGALPAGVDAKLYPLEEQLESDYYAEKYAVECWSDIEPRRDDRRS